MQSKNAEKLLEINQQLLLRDKALKLERSVAASLNEDYLTQLSAANRALRDMQEKMKGAEEVHALAMESMQKQLHDKVGG